jgi:hypothetical protein
MRGVTTALFAWRRRIHACHMRRRIHTRGVTAALFAAPRAGGEITGGGKRAGAATHTRKSRLGRHLSRDRNLVRATRPSTPSPSCFTSAANLVCKCAANQ